MKILPLVYGIKNDISSSCIRLKTAASDGYNIADRASKIYKQGTFRKYLNTTRSITGKVASGTTKSEIPYLAGAIGLMLPIPFMCPILFALGMIAKILSLKKGFLYNKQIKSKLGITV